MINVISAEEFNTSFGKAFIIENPSELHTGQAVMVNDKEYIIKKIILPSRPTEKNIVTIIVHQ